MLTATLTYSAATNLVTITDSGTAYPAYQLVDRRPGLSDVVLPSLSIGAVTTWGPTKDDCYFLVLRGGTVANKVFTAADESPVLFHLQRADHLEAEADNFAKLAKRSPSGHPLSDVNYVRARRLEAGYCLAESNPGEASLILSQTSFPA